MDAETKKMLDEAKDLIIWAQLLPPGQQASWVVDACKTIAKLSQALAKSVESDEGARRALGQR